MEMTDGRRLLDELTETELLHIVHEYIESLPEENRANSETIKRRLDICLKCEYLSNGLCALCGCFVEIRAAKSAMHCAQGDDIW